MKTKLCEIIVYESPRVRVEIFYDKLISTVEAKETASKLIIKDIVALHTSNKSIKRKIADRIIKKTEKEFPRIFNLYHDDWQKFKDQIRKDLD